MFPNKSRDLTLLNTRTTRQRCGSISESTLDRWIKDPDLAFPRPIFIGRRRYFKEADIGAWIAAREVAA
jgi:predicted DNA-binding transcriptional regulator AlpA